MARQLALQADAAPLADPWAEERRLRPGKTLVRVIDLREKLQAFLDLREKLQAFLDLREKLQVFLDLREDEPNATSMRTEFGAGITVVYRAPGRRALKARGFDAIVAEWDDAWRAEQ